MYLSRRAKGVSPSPTLTIDAKAKQMAAEGIDVVGFGAGEPDFDTPFHISQAGIRAIQQGYTRYTPAAGTMELKKAICAMTEKNLGLSYTTREVIVCCGAKHALYNLFQVICDEGDEVILPAPYWVSYVEQIKLAGAKPVIVRTKALENFILDPQQFEKAITPRTKALIINSPSNPTGAVYPGEALSRIAEIAEKHNILVVSDEIYEKLVYDGKHISIATLSPKMKELTIIINGLSKTYAMTGWRIGYALGNEEIINAMSDLQSHSTSNPATMCQKAGVEALLGSQEEVAKMQEEFKKRRDRMVRVVQDIPELSCHMPQGAFYLFVDVSRLFPRKFNGETIKNAGRLAELLLEEARVAVVPGDGFGAPEYIRLSYALSMSKIEEGLKRIKEFIAKTVA